MSDRTNCIINLPNVRRILDHNVPVYILKKTVDEGHFDCIEDARVASKEWLKYIVLSLENPTILVGMWSDIVDEIWHAYLLHTHEYFAFSRDIAGVDYFHHTPWRLMGDGQSNMPQDGGVHFKKLYNEKFGPLHSIWDSMPEAMNCAIDACCCG